MRTLANNLLGGRLLIIYRILNKHITDIIEGRKITYNPNTDIGKNLFFKGEFEKKELELCKKYIKTDAIVLDIGANIGLHSIYFSRVANKGLVFSFEPSLDTYSLLLNNIRNIDNILPLNIAISDSNKIAELYEASDSAYSSLKDTKRKVIKNRLKIICCKLDDFISSFNLSHIDFVKIDVEGLEQDVLEGMLWIMNKYHPAIFCEIYQGSNSNENPEETIRFVIDREYNAFVFNGNDLIKYQKHDDRFYNYLFLPKK